MKKQKRFLCLALAALVSTGLISCGKASAPIVTQSEGSSLSSEAEDGIITVVPSGKITEIENGLSIVRHDGDYGFDDFISQGGASSDSEVIEYLATNFLPNMNIGSIVGNTFGCSTISTQNDTGDVLFGRNFDWQNGESMIVAAYPENGFASLSTVNMDFITQNMSGAMKNIAEIEEVATLAALYAPLDGMNTEGLAVSVNMISDSATIQQNTDKPDITTTTAIRLLLDKAANVEEALTLLEQYDLHASMGMMIHFAIADSTGRSVAVEYINNEMVVIETPVLTNFYLAEGEKEGIGSSQSHQRYDTLLAQLQELSTMSIPQVRAALASVSKNNFGEFESTEWSAIFDLSNGQAQYNHRENYDKSFQIIL